MADEFDIDTGTGTGNGNGSPASVGDAMAAAGRDPAAVYGVQVDVTVVLGKAHLRVHQLLKLGRGAVVELDKKINDPVEIYANNRLIAYGEVIVTEGDRIGVSLTEIVRHN